MSALTYYSTGAASVVEGETTVTFIGALLGSAEAPTIMAGDLFVSPDQPLVPPQRIASVDYEAMTAELAVEWPGETMSSDPYEVRFTSDRVRSTAQTRRYLEMLGQIPGAGLHYDYFGGFEERSTYDEAPKGKSYLSIDGDGDEFTEPVIFLKASSAVGDWSDPIPTRYSIAEILAALGVTNITVSTDSPTGGADGDLWFKVPT